MATSTYSGPVDYAVFAVPSDAQLSEALRELLARIDSGAIELLDLEIIERGEDGTAARRPITDLEAGGDFDLSLFVGAESELLDDEDLALLVAELDGDSRALVIVYEDRSLAEVAARVAAAGGQLLWSGGVDLTELDQHISSTEVDHA